jgi:hypothetical protein
MKSAGKHTIFLQTLAHPGGLASAGLGRPAKFKLPVPPVQEKKASAAQYFPVAVQGYPKSQSLRQQL